MARSRSRTGIGRWLLLSALIVLFDQLTKVLVVRSFTLGQRRAIVDGFFDLTLVYNKGAAFSFLSDAGGWQRWFFMAVAIGVSVWIALWLQRLPAEKRWLSASLALILGGAVGNLIDRVIQGYVVDFIFVHWGDSCFPAFNVADSAITVGAIMMMVDVLFLDREDRHADQAG